MNYWRSALVLLLCVNVGVAVWWRNHTTAPFTRRPETDPGVPSLVLQHEFLQLQQAKQRLRVAACWQIGPFASQEEMQKAWQTLEYIAVDMQYFSRLSISVLGYRVYIPAAPSRRIAVQYVEQLNTHGIRDAQILEQGIAANSIALGDYATLETAQNRQKQAQSLGFAAVLESVQNPKNAWWIQAGILNTSGFEQWRAENQPKIPAQACP